MLDYFEQYAGIAKEQGGSLILESPTWRASKSWGDQLGYSAIELAEANKKCIELLAQVRDDFQSEDCKIVISGCIGPKGDGYSADDKLSVHQATDYHRAQIHAFSQTDADFVSAFTMTHVEEAIGIVSAAKECDIPVVISFTVETDGTLPSGQTLGEAIEQVDRETSSGPAYYMINCEHPNHFVDTLAIGDQGWLRRIKGIRANASKMSHEEFDNAEELDAGCSVELARDYLKLRELLPNLNVLGGCCGTNHTHVQAIAEAWKSCE